MEYYINKGKQFSAVHFNRINFEELWAFTNGNVYELSIKGEEPGQAYCTLKSYYGDIQIQEGDYVFTDGRNYYALPPDYFTEINEIAVQNFKPPVEEEPIKK